MKRLRLFCVVALVAGLVATTSFQETASAQPTGPGKVVASGLNSPRFMVVNDDGSIYVTETGAAGNESIPQPPDARPGLGPVKRGYTGQVTKINPDGSKSVIAGNLPSADPGDGGLVGPEGLVVAGGAIWVVTGTELLPDPTPRLKNDGSLLRIDPQTGNVQKVADITANEIANNPQKNTPHGTDSDPYGLALGPDGNLYVNDAAGNDLYRVNPDTGALSVVTVFDGLPARDPNPERGGKKENDPVPTGIAAGADGNFYIGLLGGGAPIHGMTKVVRVTPSGTVSDYATGLTYVTGVTMGPDKLIYITQFTTGLDLTAKPPMPMPGQVVRVNADGSQTVVADKLPLPNQTAFDKAGNMYVTTFSANVPPGQGQIVRFDGVAQVGSGVPLPPTGVNDGPIITFPQTGFSLSGTFLGYWNVNGALPVFGFPIDSERQVNGKIFQWFERNRFEKHPENKAPYNVELGLLGVEGLAKQGIDWHTLPTVSSAPAGCQYFAATSHSLCGDFLNYWQQHGLKFDNSAGYTYAESVALFGYPISEPNLETNSSGETVLTQWFERGRFEYHPDKSTSYQVLLGRLGAELFTGN